MQSQLQHLAHGRFFYSALVSQSGYSIQIKNYECCAPSVEYSSGPQHISGQEIDGRLPGGRIGRKIIEHQLFIEE